MTVADLREILDGLDDGTEVRLMSQPSWPFEYSIAGTWTAEPQPTCQGFGPVRDTNDEPPADGFTPAGSPEAGVLYLVEGQQLAYGSKRAWDEAIRW